MRTQWMMSVALMAVTVLLTGCGTVFSRAAADVLVPVEEENRLGREIAREIDAELTFHSDTEVVQYVQNLGQQILRRVDNVPSGIRFYFRVVDDPNTINAFAIPGGGIYIYTGLMRAMDNEAELVAVLSHEIAHVTRRHIAQRLVAAYGAQRISEAALGNDPGLIGSLAATVIGQGFLLRYSRDQERDADEIGFEYMVAANYNPEGFVTFFRKLEGQPTPPTIISSHPPPSERVQYLTEMIRALDQRPTRLEAERFLQIKARL
jgi:beta-barrel assembly-enhancing protease